MKFATIGTSRITDQFIEASKDSGKMTLEAVYSRTKEQAKKFAEKHGAPKIYDNFEELAEDPDIDVVYIASPNSMHFEQSLQFLEHQKHVICEKPMFTTLEEWKAAYKTAEENGVYLFEAMRTIHSPNFKHLKDNLYKAGTLRSANLTTIQYSSRYDRFLDGELPNIFSSEFAGGALMDLGVYPLYMAILLFGQPKSAVYHPVMLKSGVDGSGTLILEYEGFICTIMCSKIAPSQAPSEIHGEAGTLLIDKVSTIDSLKFYDRITDQTEELDEEESVNNMVYEIDAFVHIINENNQKEYSMLKQVSYDVLSVLEKARIESGILFDSER